MKKILVAFFLFLPSYALATLPAIDNFNRADASPDASGNWTAIKNNIQIVSNAAQGTTFNFTLAKWSADTFGNDQYAQCKILTISDGGPGVRLSGTSGSPNTYHYDCKAGNQVVMQKIVAGASTNLQSGLTTPALNDTIYIEVSGTTIKLKNNGVQIGSNQTDNSLSSGSAGFFDFDTNARFDDFQADNIGGAAAVVLRQTILRGSIMNGGILR